MNINQNQFLLQQYYRIKYYKNFYSNPIPDVKIQQKEIKPILDVKIQQKEIKPILDVKIQQKEIKPIPDVKIQQKEIKPVLDVKIEQKEIKPVLDLENYGLIKNEIKKTINTLAQIKDKRLRLNYLGNLKTIYKFQTEHNNSLEVCLLEGYIVKKKCFGNSLGNYMFQNEVAALSKLSGYPHFPLLFEYDKNMLIIYMSYCGNLISSKNIPLNWKEQVNEIKEIMTTLNVNSNDMIPRNICCLDNEIKIIDFGLNTIFGKTINEIINDLYGNLNNFSKNQNQNLITNFSLELNYLKEYKNWKEKLENYIKKEKEMKELHNKYLLHLKQLRNKKK
jgi:tRNA A-37 threonylcarbamoyl transferase component Bud32